MTHSNENVEQAKAYAKPTLERRAKLTDVAEGIPVVISGVAVGR